MDASRWPIAANLHYVTYPPYLEQLQRSLATGECLFCDPDNLPGTELVRSGGWALRENNYPTKGRDGRDPAGHYLMFKIMQPGEVHLQDISEMSSHDWMDIHNLRLWLQHHRDVRGGGLATRFGDPDRAGWTVGHLHFHIVVPHVGVPVDFPIG